MCMTELSDDDYIRSIGVLSLIYPKRAPTKINFGNIFNSGVQIVDFSCCYRIWMS